MRHEEAGAFAAQGEALLLDRLTAVAGSCGPGSLHFINGLYEANRNRAPVVLIASQIVRSELGFDFIQEVDFKSVYKGCSVFCEMIMTPGACAAHDSDGLPGRDHQARRRRPHRPGRCCRFGSRLTSSAYQRPCQPARDASQRGGSRRDGGDLLRARLEHHDLRRLRVQQDAHDEVVQLAARLAAPVAHTHAGKDALEYDNPHNIGMTGVIGMEAGYQLILNCDTLLLLGTDFAWQQFYPSHAKIIQVDIDPTHIGRRHPVTLGVVGNIKDTLQALLPRLDAARRLDISGHLCGATQRRPSKHRPPGRHPAITARSQASISLRSSTGLPRADALFAGDDGTPVVWLLGMMASERPAADVRQSAARNDGQRARDGDRTAEVPTRAVRSSCMAGDGGLSMLFGDRH